VRIATALAAWVALSALSSPAREVVVLCGGGRCPVGERAPVVERHGEIALENLDRSRTVTARLRREGWPDLDSDRAILASIVRDEMTPEARALAIWEFVRAWRYSCEPYSEASQELHDPVKLVGVFGCGLCDDTNAALASLARLAGMPARVWGLGGHVVSEIAWDGAWHLFDAADGVYFRDESGDIAGVETLARHPGLLSSATNRAQRRPALERMAELVARGAGPDALGHRLAVQRHFAGRFRQFLAARGEAASATLDPEEFDRLIAGRYAELLTTTSDNAVSDWWLAAGSGHRMALPLHPLDRVVYRLRQVSEARMGCYLGAATCLEAEGRMTRAALDPLARLLPGGDEAVVVERLPYAVEALSLDGRSMPAETVLDVYLAPLGDGAGLEPDAWTALGRLAAREVPGAPPLSEAPDFPRPRLEHAFAPSAAPAFGYRLKLVRRGHASRSLLQGVKLSTSFMAAGKSLPWPAADAAPVYVETDVDGGAVGGTPGFAGLRVTFRLTD
jgi:hypothetical protein